MMPKPRQIDLQLFAEEEEPVTPTGEETEEEVLPDVEPVEEEYDEITYNSETVKIPASERKTYLQKGYNYDKVKSRVDEYEAKLNRLQELTGADVDTLAKQIEEYASMQAAQTRADELGVPVEQVKPLLESEKRLKQIEDKLTKQEKATLINQQKAELKDQPFFADLEPEVDELITKGDFNDVRKAYLYLRGEKFDQLLEAERKKAADEALKDYERQASRGVETSDGSPVATKDIKFTATEAEWAEDAIRRGVFKNKEEAWLELEKTKRM